MTPVRSFCLILAALLAAVSAGVVGAQTRVNNSGTGGIDVIKGQIYSAGNTRADGQVTVRLQSFSQGELTLVTDQGGGFEFRALAPGTYVIVVDAGDRFETFRESVTIDPTVQVDPNARVPPIPKTFNVPVYLRLKQNASERASVLNAKLAGVPKDALRHYEKGLELADGGKANEALAEFKLAIIGYQTFPAAYLEIGKIHLKGGRFDEAVEALHTAQSLDQNDFETTLDYGIALYGKRDLLAAEPQLTRSVQMNATAVTPHYYLGLISIQQKNMEKAQQELEAAKHLSGDKNFPLLHRYLGGVYLERKMNKEAVAELETYLKMAPATPDAGRIRQTIADLKAKSN